MILKEEGKLQNYFYQALLIFNFVIIKYINSFTIPY